MAVFMIVILLIYLGLMGLVTLASIDKAFLDSIIVVISLLGLILNNLQHDCPKIEKILKKLTDSLVNIFSWILIIFGVLWIVSIFFCGAPNWLPIIGIVSVFVGGVIWKYRKKIEQSKGLSFAIYFITILVVYIIFLFNDPQTKATLNNITKVLFGS